ncbi:hypothetical protein HZF08_07500 [Paenibacillus sp. CGMCC 1.16610]|uniref:Phosphatidylinositol kinase n=2 Tax=Paenibacillus TaxID=44249 RepID=A0ABU3RCB7_9BACL|nr:MULTISPECIES: hypothetical protein [Paenibacillus]MBA2938147.1 hypothetical protein [Paenibacillus sp. CGMCC 1.16610]MDU0201684.1 hypothetical protein [Paenibacillus sp. PFR10]MEC0265691.1 hypothetical protein [Paenibacillus anseongense]MVQ37204.1 hypothetical protein [Paenibacillus anseongense]
MKHPEIHEICKKHMYRYVSVTMTNGAVYDGIVENVDDDNLYLAVPIGGMDHEQMRAFLPYGGYPFPYYGYPYPGYGYGFGRRRFARQVLPLAGLLALSLLPYY